MVNPPTEFTAVEPREVAGRSVLGGQSRRFWERGWFSVAAELKRRRDLHLNYWLGSSWGLLRSLVVLVGGVFRGSEAGRALGMRATAKTVRDSGIRHCGGREEKVRWDSRTDTRAPDPHRALRHQMPSISERDLGDACRESFPCLRETPRERLSARRPDRRGRWAVQTMVQNEAVFLPIWLAYYSRFFDASDIYVLDHDSTDGSTSGGGFVRVEVTHGTFDNIWMNETLEDHQRELLDRYDLVLTVDADEIVAPDPELATLSDYLDRFDEEFVNPLGYELLHFKDDEPPFQPNRPVLEQRRWWFANDGYNKPALAMAPTPWQPGRHSRTDGRRQLDSDLRLIHLHRMDYEIALARHRRWRDRPWNERDLAEGWGTHNRIVEEREFEHWFYEDSAFEGLGTRRCQPPRNSVEPIPAHWRGLF